MRILKGCIKDLDKEFVGIESEIERKYKEKYDDRVNQVNDDVEKL